MTRAYFLSIYALSWVVFGAGGLALNAVCAVLLLLPNRAACGPAVREAIRKLFGAWVAWLHATRVVSVTWRGPGPASWPRPAVVVANHPSLLDATLILSRLPDAICIFKPALLRNPFLAPAAIMAGYPAGGGGIDLIHAAARDVAAGRTLLVFPEGTRTAVGSALGPLKPGFALIARRAGVPIQVLIVRTDGEVLARGRQIWRVPRLPVRFEITVDRTIVPSPERTPGELTAEVRDRFAEWLGAAA